MKKYLPISILSMVLLISACGSQVNLSPNKIQTIEQSNRSTVFNVSDKAGASFGVKINLQAFSTKANVSGKPAKQPSDVKKVDVYLLKLPETFSGTDPLGTNSANVVKKFTDVEKTGTSITMTFTNVPGLAGTDQYWIGVVAKDDDGNIISKAPTTAWAGTTLTSAPAMALSSSGVGINETTLKVSSEDDLSVSISLLDAVGASISSTATLNAGNPSPSPILAVGQ